MAPSLLSAAHRPQSPASFQHSSAADDMVPAYMVEAALGLLFDPLEGRIKWVTEPCKSDRRSTSRPANGVSSPSRSKSRIGLRNDCRLRTLPTSGAPLHPPSPPRDVAPVWESPASIYPRRGFSFLHAALSLFQSLPPHAAELLRTQNQFPLSIGALFVGCSSVTQPIDFTTCHVCGFRRALRALARSGRAGSESALEQPADRFGARGRRLLMGDPGVQSA